MSKNATLSEAIKVLNEKMSNAAKRTELIKLGFSADETARLMREFGRLWSEAAPAAPAIVYTFGVELEVYNVADRRQMVAEAASRGLTAQYEGYNHDDNDRYFKFVTDGSIVGDYGIECVSPVLKGKAEGYASVKAICAALQAAGAKVNTSTGYHVHVGGEITDEQYVNVFVNYQRMQKVIDTFMAPSRRNCHWCAPYTGLSLEACQSPADVRHALNNRRYWAVNPLAWSRHRTIEFRQHAGTVNATKVIAWAKFCLKLVAWSRDHRLTENVTDVAQIPFLTAAEKRYFTERAHTLSPETAAPEPQFC